MVGKSEWKRVFDARNTAEVARGHARVDAAFAVEVQPASLGATSPSPSKPPPRKAFEAALARAEGLVAGAVGLDEDGARALVAEGIASTYPADPKDGSPLGTSAADSLTLKALMSPVKGAPGYSLEDDRQLHLKERIGEGEDSRRQGRATVWPSSV